MDNETRIFVDEAVSEVKNPHNLSHLCCHMTLSAVERVSKPVIKPVMKASD
jgi:hypothetical protein